MTVKRKTLAKGIYRDASGVMIRISVHGKPIDYRRDSTGTPYEGRALGWLRQERIRRQAAATLTDERRAQARDTLAVDIDRYLATISSASHKVNSQGYLAHWARVLGDRPRHSLTDVELQTAFAAINKASSTKRHIRHALICLYDTLDGTGGPNPARRLPLPPKAQADVRSIPYADIERIFKQLQPSRTRARLKVIAYTGLPQSLIAKLRPGDLRLAAREVIVRPRRKGAGVGGRTLPLSDAGVAALQEFAAMDAFGTFQNRQVIDTFRAGAKAAGVTLAPDARPYDLRHSFLTEVYRATGDLRAVAELGMHSTLEQTARYAKGAVSERATKAIQAVPRFSTTTTTRKSPKRSTSVQSKPGRAHAKRAAAPGKKRGFS